MNFAFNSASATTDAIDYIIKVVSIFKEIKVKLFYFKHVSRTFIM